MGALLFDLDGVLVNSFEAYRAAWTAWAASYGITKQEFPTDIHGLRPHDVVREVLTRARPGLDLAQAIETFDAAMDGPATAGVAAMAGAVALTRALAGRPWAIVSSTHARHLGLMIAAAGLAPPPVLISGDDIERGKPDPQCFLAAAERLGVPATGCTVIEDAPPGIRAAAAAGMACVAVATTHDAGELTGAGHCYPNLLAARDHLLGVLGP